MDNNEKVLIRTWSDLVGLENDNYRLVIDVRGCNGHIEKKDDDSYYRYLSTHTFYGRTYIDSTVTLQECGFNVQLENWDGETEYVDYREQWKYHGECEHCYKKDNCPKQCPINKYITEEQERFDRWNKAMKDGLSFEFGERDINDNWIYGPSLYRDSNSNPRKYGESLINKRNKRRRR